MEKAVKKDKKFFENIEAKTSLKIVVNIPTKVNSLKE
jgi:hypothetical protein